MASDSEDEVLGVGVSSDEEDDHHLSDMADSDVEGQGGEDDDIPNVHAWGKDKRKYYQTDYVDQDYGGYQGKDAVLADQEEEEAANLQKELTQKLNEAAFSLDFIEMKETDSISDAEVSVTDTKKLSKRQKIELLKKESPEFFGLLDEYKQKNAILQQFLDPIIKLEEKGKISNCPPLQFVHTFRDLINNYITCITFYYLLKTSKTSVSNHPVIKRINQFRELIMQMHPVFEENIQPQIELLMQIDKDETEVLKTKSKTLKILQKLSTGKNTTKKVVFSAENSIRNTENDENSSSEEKEEEIDEEEMENGESRRPITYQIAKNKGLTPHRKKEQRNPRVKYKNRFRKATMRRKGAVRSVRTETSRYGGEISGIKTSVSKSIKIKT